MEKVQPMEKLIAEMQTRTPRNSGSNVCMFGKCQNKPIKSHAISQSFLKNLGYSDSLLMSTPYLISIFKDMKNGNQLDYVKPIALDVFSTFNGFCKYHDNRLFSAVDNFDGHVTNEVAVLIHYRNICYGILHIKAQLSRLQHAANQEYINNASSKGEDILRSLKGYQLRKRLMESLYEHRERKRELERMIRKQHFSKIRFITLHGDINNPIFSGRSTPWLHPQRKIADQDGYTIMPWISYLTLVNKHSHQLVFCWLARDKVYANDLELFFDHDYWKANLEILAYGFSDAFAISRNLYNESGYIINYIATQWRTN